MQGSHWPRRLFYARMHFVGWWNFYVARQDYALGRVGLFSATSSSSSFAPHSRFRPRHRYQLLVFALISVRFSTSTSFSTLFVVSTSLWPKRARSLSVPRCVIRVFTVYTHFAIPLSFCPHPLFCPSLPHFRSFLTSHPANPFSFRAKKQSAFTISRLYTALHRDPLR